MLIFIKQRLKLVLGVSSDFAILRESFQKVSGKVQSKDGITMMFDAARCW
jgi:hypothetical protein